MSLFPRHVCSIAQTSRQGNEIVLVDVAQEYGSSARDRRAIREKGLRDGYYMHYEDGLSIMTKMERKYKKMQKLKEGMEVTITVPARVVEVDSTGGNARITLYIDTNTQWFDTAHLEPLEEVLEMRRQVMGVFEAANAIDGGKLPSRKDAVEYIQYLRDTLNFMVNLSLQRERELEALGWKRPDWTIASDGATWTMVQTEREQAE